MHVLNGKRFTLNVELDKLSTGIVTSRFLRRYLCFFRIDM